MSDTTVRCDKCGCEKRVSFGACLRSGWPKCCGYTMRMLTTKADIAAVTTDVLRAQSAEGAESR
jgi:hypothetical protein